MLHRSRHPGRSEAESRDRTLIFRAGLRASPSGARSLLLPLAREKGTCGRAHDLAPDGVLAKPLAGGGVAGLVAAAQGLHALGAGAVGEGLGTGPAAREAVVADGAGGVQALLDVAGLQRHLAARDGGGVGGPDA